MSVRPRWKARKSCSCEGWDRYIPSAHLKMPSYEWKIQVHCVKWAHSWVEVTIGLCWFMVNSKRNKNTCRLEQFTSTFLSCRSLSTIVLVGQKDPWCQHFWNWTFYPETGLDAHAVVTSMLLQWASEVKVQAGREIFPRRTLVCKNSLRWYPSNSLAHCQWHKIWVHLLHGHDCVDQYWLTD